MSGTSVKLVAPLKISHTIPAPREKVFRAWIDRNELKNWFVPSDGYTVAFAEVNPRKNTRYRIGLRDQKGELHVYGGVFQELRMPEELRYTWARNGGGTQQWKTLITVRFSEDGDRTVVDLTHAKFPTEEMRAEFEQGWKNCLKRLEEYVK